MRVFLAGGGGQLGRELIGTAPGDAAVAAPNRKQLSITDPRAVARAVAEARPELVINAAAYTAVDAAETDRAAAHGVNVEGARALAQAAADTGARLIHVSTDFVFAGDRGEPYRPQDPTGPIGVYGESKLAGERAVAEVDSLAALIVRTSWLYSRHRANFVKTMLRLLRERSEIRVVMDQVGSPTWARSLARAIWRWAELPAATGIRHLSDAGVASWYDFAVAIREEAAAVGLLDSSAAGVEIRPIRTADYPTPARRPASSILDSLASWQELGIAPRHWREALRLMLGDLQETQREDATHV